jgi:hypothetical protein
MEKVLYWGPTGVRWHCTKFSHASSFALGVCSPLYWCALFELWVSKFWRRRLPQPSGPQIHSHEGYDLKAKDTAFSHFVCNNFYSFLGASCLLVEKITLAAFAVLRSVWYRTVDTMQGTHTNWSVNLVNRKSFLTCSDFHSLCQQVQEKYERKHPHSEWRYELRVRYLPQNLTDLYEKDRVTFYYYYDQVSISVSCMYCTATFRHKAKVWNTKVQLYRTYLMFIGPCSIAIYFYSKSDQMHQLLKFILFWNNTLHVSDGLSVHHREFKTVRTATCIFQPGNAACLLASRQQYLFLYVQSWTPDAGRKDHPKHVECYSKIK